MGLRFQLVDDNNVLIRTGVRLGHKSRTEFVNLHHRLRKAALCQRRASLRGRGY